MDPDARKGRVFDVAPGRLQASGFASTTLEDIARAADLREADVRALFGDKEGLMGELVSPLLDRLRAIATAAAEEPRHDKQLRELIERYLDALAADRLLVSVVLGDPTAAQCPPVLDVRAAIAALREALAGGPEADLDHRIRAASALGAVQAAVLELADVEPATVRGVITDAAVAILLS